MAGHATVRAAGAVGGNRYLGDDRIIGGGAFVQRFDVVQVRSNRRTWNQPVHEGVKDERVIGTRRNRE